MDKIEQNVIKGIDIYIGNVLVFNDSHEALRDIFAFVAMNLFVGEECGHNEDIFELFKNLINSFVSAFYAPKILSFLHPWFHDQTDVLQFFLNDPEIAPDLDPNNVNCNMIADVIGIFILAAMSSTSYRASYALYEAQAINKQCNGKFKTCNDINKMVKLDRFIKEAFRLNADVLGLPRQCVTEPHYTFTNGYQIPSELYLNEKLQGPNPKEFNASRHKSSTTKLDHNFLLFGHGKHICPGRNYAVTLTKITLHHIMLKYNFRTKFENGIARNHLGFFIGPAKPGESSIVFENK
ncbi:3721_t:CDS:2 [Gigaspora margarita]|uniref:3721_t:CDS:1 n=1 Tax=Gigaspora margarita TaxID=4874 RepID=A0ABN7UPK3_GIGMA|nr:3721_t:CDS:2 [Gigaspora margarita]